MIDSVTKRRLGRTLSAQLYSQIVTIACQLALVPLFLWAWGAERYGAWLVLTAVPIFLTFSDFGFTFVAKNEMLIAVASKEKSKALRTFQSVFGLLNIVAPVIATFAIVLIFTFDPVKWLSVRSLTTDEGRWVLLAFTLNVVSYQYFLLVCAGIRSENRPATETIWAATSRLVESGIFGVSAICSTNLAIAAMLGLTSRVAFLLAAYAYLRRLSPWLSLGHSAATRSEIARLAHPAFAYMLMPIGQALLLQGPVIVLGKLSGPASVVLFATSRTLARVGASVTNMFNNTFVAEYSSTAGRGDMHRFRHLRRVQILVSTVLILGYVLALSFLADPLMQVFTHGKVRLQQPFFFVMILAVAAEMFWSAQFTSISAVNRHKTVTYYFAGISLLGIIGCYLAVPHLGVLGAAICLVIVNLAMMLVCAWTSSKFARLEKMYASETNKSA